MKLSFNQKFPILKTKIISGNFIKMELKSFFGEENFSIIEISLTIFQVKFYLRHLKIEIEFFAGMFQKEVAKRICERPGSKACGILQFFVKSSITLNTFSV